MIRILFLAANPIDQSHLRVRQEFNELRQALDSAEHRSRFELIQEFAAAANQLQDLLFRHRPHIVHFSGHGTAGGLVFEGADGRSNLVAPQTLRDLFAGFKQQVRCVVLNACYSETQAAAIATVIDSVVGMSNVLTDDAALAFGVAFHRALANGTTLGEAVALGCNQLDLQNLDEAHKPHLLAKRIEPMRMRALDWDDTPLATAPRATQRGIFGLYPFNEHFFGREEELASLHTLLQTEQSVSICPVITGMGGLGKTQLAAHYARAHIADYPDGIFWITAADLNAIRPQLADFCVALGLPVADPQRSSDLTEQKISAFKGYLDQHPRALLIFDNVEEPDHLRTRPIGVQLSALTLGGKAIVTTRRRKLAGDKFAELALQRLLPAPARQILTTARPALATDPDLDRLCAQFGYLPLMLNLAAAALTKRGGTIAGYLQRLHTLGAEQLHGAVAKVNLDDYHKSLAAVLQEQWAMLHDENACLLLRVAGQLPEAAVIPTARLGLLAGLVDVDEWERPLSDALDELEHASLIERVDEATLRLHPLVHNFAAGLIVGDESAAFRMACVQRLANAYLFDESGLRRLGSEYATRGIAALLLDLITALELRPSLIPDPLDLGPNLEFLLRLLRLEANKLWGAPSSWQPERLWQQLLLRPFLTANTGLAQQLDSLLCHTLHWLPHWAHQRQSGAVEQTLSGHKARVKAVAMLDAQHIVSASDDGTLKIWNLYTGQDERTFTSHEDSFYAVTRLDEQRIVSTSRDGTLKIWNLTTSDLDQTLPAEKAGFRTVAALDTNRFVYTLSDGTLKVWNHTNNSPEQSIMGHAAKVVAALDASHIVYATHNGIIEVWNLANNSLEHKSDKAGWIDVIAVIDAKRIVYAANHRMIEMWDFTATPQKQTLTAEENHLCTLAVLDANHIVSATLDGTLKLWNLATGAVEQIFIGHEDSINAVARLDANRFVSASDDGTLKVWNLHAGQAEEPFIGHTRRVNAVARLDANRFVSASYDGTLKIWNIGTGVLEQEIPQIDELVDDELEDEDGPVLPEWFDAVAVLDDRRIIAIAEDQEIWIYTATGELEQRIVEEATAVAALDAAHIVSASQDGILKIWNLNTAKAEQTSEYNETEVNALAVIDEQRIVVVADDVPLKVLKLEAGTIKVEHTFPAHEDKILSMTVLDPNHIITASDDGTLKIWNLREKEVEHTLTGHEAGVNAVAVFDPNRIVAAADDRTLKLWDLTTGRVIASIELDAAPQCVTVVRQAGRPLVVAGDAGGALYCLALVEPVESDKVTG